MTQVPVAPAQGIAATPVAIAAGVLATIPAPKTGVGGSAPVPWATGWCVLLNSSPYTLLVSSGGQVTQIAAFTSDKVFVNTVNANNLTVLAQAGAAVAVPGQDSTVYATWYNAEPPGTYPAALGSSGALLAVPSTLIPVTTIAVPATGSLVLPTGAPVSTSGFGGATFSVPETSTFAPIIVLAQWFADAAGTQVIWSKRWVVAPGGESHVTLPHRGPFFSLSISSGTGVAASTTVFATQAVAVPAESWSTTTQGNRYLIQSAGVAVGAVSQALIGAARLTYAGPVTLHADIDTPNIAAGPVVFVFYLNDDATTVLLTGLTFPAGGGAGSWTPALTFIAPPFPLRVQAFNSTAAPITMRGSLIADDWRS